MWRHERGSLRVSSPWGKWACEGSPLGLRGVLEGSTRSPRGLRGVYEESTRDFRRVYTGSTRSLREIYEGSARARISRISPHETRDFLTSSILDLILITSFWPRSWTSFADMSHAMWNFKAWIRNVDNKQSRQSLAIIFLEQEQPEARTNVSNAREKASHKRESRRSRNFSLSRIDVSAFGGKVGDKRFFPQKSSPWSTVFNPCTSKHLFLLFTCV